MVDYSKFDKIDMSDDESTTPVVPKTESDDKGAVRGAVSGGMAAKSGELRGVTCGCAGLCSKSGQGVR